MERRDIGEGREDPQGPTTQDGSSPRGRAVTDPRAPWGLQGDDFPAAIRL
jgi:hypothetical protein